MLFLYTILVFLASLGAAPLAFLLDLRDPEAREDWKARLGFPPNLKNGSRAPIWVQAVSVGEVQLARQLVLELRRQRPELSFLLSSTTPAGRKFARKIALPGVEVFAFPLDLPWATGAVVQRIRPRALILMETEIWPNLLRACLRSDVPILMVNGRISRRSHSRYRRFRSALAPMLRRMTMFLMQSPVDGERVRDLGAPADRVVVTGNLKWDLPEPSRSSAEIRKNLGIPISVPVLVAGSTFEGEEASLVEIWESLRGDFPELRLVLAPRHPRRFDRVAALLAQRGVPFSRRSGSEDGREWSILLLDSMGELRDVYAAGTICFVGGSFVHRGGQNLMEPAAAGRPVLFGPRVENFKDAATALLKAGGGFQVNEPGELIPLIRRLLGDSAAEEAGRRARGVVAAHRGATARATQIILVQLASGGS